MAKLKHETDIFEFMTCILHCFLRARFTYAHSSHPENGETD